MNDDAATFNHICSTRIIRIAHLVVVDDVATRLIPDLDTEAIHATSARYLPIVSRQQEAIISTAIDRARALVLGLGPRYHQPFVGSAVEVQFAGVELELRLTRRRSRIPLVLRHKVEVRFARGALALSGQLASTCRRVDPTATSHEAAVRVVDYHIPVDRFPNSTIVIGHRQLDGIDTRSRIGAATCNRARPCLLRHRACARCAIAPVPDSRMCVRCARISEAGTGLDAGIDSHGISRRCHCPNSRYNVIDCYARGILAFTAILVDDLPLTVEVAALVARCFAAAPQPLPLIPRGGITPYRRTSSPACIVWS